MTDETIKTSESRELWRRLPRERALGDEALGDWEANALAAALEGGLSEPEAERLEARLNDSPALLETFLAAGDEAIGADTPPPKALIERAKALGPASGAERLVSVPRPANENRRHWRTRVEWAAVAAAIVIFAGVGFELGSDTWRGARKIQIAMASGTGLDFNLGGQSLSASFSFEDFDDAFSRGEI
ncbi:MAG: hypothetical protein ACTSUD_04760 [Alphaproteobacteria bacterium]